MERRYLTIAEAARMMRVGRPKVERMLAEGRLRAVGKAVGRRLVDVRDIARVMADPA